MVSRQETSRALPTPGEVMQLPRDDELVLVSGCPPIRAKKARYFEDRELQARIQPPPKPSNSGNEVRHAHRAQQGAGEWADVVVLARSSPAEDPANSGIRREPVLPEHEEIAPEPSKPVNEFEPLEDEPDDGRAAASYDAASGPHRAPGRTRSRRRNGSVIPNAHSPYDSAPAGRRLQARRLRSPKAGVASRRRRGGGLLSSLTRRRRPA